MVDFDAPKARLREIPGSGLVVIPQTVSVDLVEAMEPGRKNSFTFAPEAGSQRLRQAINKPLTEDDLLNAVTAAFTHGYTNIKLYYMIGLPTETMEDVMAIPEMVKRAMAVGRKHAGGRAKINVALTPGRFLSFSTALTPTNRQWCTVTVAKPTISCMSRT